MSHWLEGKMKLNCSIAVLRRALINIMPEWENAIKVDESGNLDAHNQWQGAKKGCHVVVKLGASDLGFVQNPDGTWKVWKDTYVLHNQHLHEDCEGKITQEVMTMRARALAQETDVHIEGDYQSADTNTIVLDLPADQLAQMGF